jgi:hypothetical protein
MSRLSIGSAVLSLALAGCVVNGKKLFDLPGGSSSSSSSGESTSSDGGLPASVAALPEAKAPASYAWCAGLPTLNEHLDIGLGDELVNSVPSLVANLCQPDDEARAARGKLEARRLAWMKQLGMTEADWAADAPAWAAGLTEYAAIYRTEHYYDVPRRRVARAGMGPIAQYAELMEDGYNSTADSMVLSETGRLGYVARCLEGPIDEANLARWIACLPDIDSLDVAKIGAELREDKDGNTDERMSIRRRLSLVLAELPAKRERIGALIASSAANKQALSFATQARAQWPSTAKQPERAALLGLLAKVAASDTDCPVAWKEFSTRLAKLGRDTLVKTPRETIVSTVNGIIYADPHLALAASAILYCKSTAFNRLIEPGTVNLVEGPRTAAFRAVLDTTGWRPRFDDGLDDEATRSQREVVDTVARVAIADGKATIHFPEKGYTAKVCKKERKTDRMIRVHDNGWIEYEVECLQWGTERIDQTRDPIAISAERAGGIGKGAQIYILQGAFVGAWKDGVTRNVFGIELK